MELLGFNINLTLSSTTVKLKTVVPQDGPEGADNNNNETRENP